METKNIYQKLQEARIQLSEKDLKKSGHNNFSGYYYFELSDFMPSVIEIFRGIGLTGIVNFEIEKATLIIVNSDKPEESITFTSPVAGVDLKGMHAIQNLGAVQTYLRRYLYMSAMDITEPDALDAKDNTKPDAKEPEKEDNRPWMTDAQFKKAIERIKAGEQGVYEKAKAACKMKKEYSEQLKNCKPETK